MTSTVPATADARPRGAATPTSRSSASASNDAPLVYLDSAATSQKPQAVIDAEVAFLTGSNAAVHRGAHTLAAEATELFEDARATVARLRRRAARASSSGRAARPPGINLVAYAIGNASAGRGGEAARRFALAPGDEIVVTESEHHANLIPWQELAARTGAVLRHIPVHDDGTLDLDAAASVIGERTRVVAFPHVSNVLGIVNPVAELVALAQRRRRPHRARRVPVGAAPAARPPRARRRPRGLLGPQDARARTAIGGLYGRARGARAPCRRSSPAAR